MTYTDRKLERIEEQISRFKLEVAYAQQDHDRNVKSFGTGYNRWTAKSKMDLEIAEENLRHYETRKWYLLNA